MATGTMLWSGLISSTASSDSITAGISDPAGHSGQLDLSVIRDLAIFVQLKTLTGGTTPSVQVLVATGDGQAGASQYWTNLNPTAPTWTSAVNQYYTSAGPGTDNAHSIGDVGKIVWNITGGPTGCTFYVTIYGKQ